jgi:hypothetical protein
LKNPTGRYYTPKVGYKVLCEGEVLGNQLWWFKPIWKFKCPLKSGIFIWLVLRNKVPILTAENDVQKSQNLGGSMVSYQLGEGDQLFGKFLVKTYLREYQIY